MNSSKKNNFFLGCDVTYRMEPLSSVPCNPYNVSDGSMFELQCAVDAPATVAASRLDVLWFFTNTSGDTVQISSDTFSSLNGISSVDGFRGSLVLNSEISFRRFVSPTHAGSYFCRVSVSGAAASFSQSNSQTYDRENDLLKHSPCDVYAGPFSHPAFRCAGNITSIPSTSTDKPSSNIDTAVTSTAMSSLSHISIFDSITTVATNNQLQPDRFILHPWIYVLVGVAALIGIIIIIIVILCIRCCLKKIKTTDSFKRE